MWSRKELKSNARKMLRHNYWRMVAICLLIAFFAGEASQMLTVINSYVEIGSNNSVISDTIGSGMHQKSNSEIVDEILREMGYQKYRIPGSEATQGVLAGIVNNIGEAGSFLFGMLNVVNQFLFRDSVGAVFIILFGLLLRFLYRCIISNVLIVGKNRFFMETVTYEHAPVQRMLFAYRIRRTLKVAFVMFMRGLFQTLWWLTIAGGLIKYYSYSMVPYIVAENPEISWRRAMELSKRMTKGQKWKMFLLDLSFAGWYVLNAMLFGLLDLFYVVPYKNSVRAQLYKKLRSQAIAEKYPFYEELDDRYLFAEPSVIPEGTKKIDDELRMLEYPTQLFKIPEEKRRAWLKVEYDRKYSFLSIVLIFFAFAIVGWLWEVLLHMVQYGEFVNRGTLYGPWLPIYGCGGCLAILFLRKTAKRPLVTFFLTMALCGALEYGTAWFLETTKGVKWWDYTGYFLNLHGRICAEGLLVFGIGGCAAIYVLGPALDELFLKIAPRIKKVLCAVLITAFLCDLVYSYFHPNTGEGITQEVSEEETDAGENLREMLDKPEEYDKICTDCSNQA